MTKPAYPAASRTTAWLRSEIARLTPHCSSKKPRSAAVWYSLGKRAGLRSALARLTKGVMP